MTESIRKYNNLTQRIITGVLGSAVIITGVCLTEWAYVIIFLIIGFFTLREFYKLIHADGIFPETFFGLFTGLIIFLLTLFVARGNLPAKFLFLLFPLMAIVFVVKLYSASDKKPFTNIAFTFLGLVYVMLPVSLMNFTAYNSEGYNFEIVLGTLLILWSTDTGAYFAGTFLGKTKLFPRISPKKTWEGFAGGAALALLFAYGLSRYFYTLSVIDWFAVAVIIIVCGTLGDLVESLLKRSIAVKDSGNVLPGHGGFLDRFDGLLIALPFITAYLQIF